MNRNKKADMLAVKQNISTQIEISKQFLFVLYLGNTKK